MPRLYVYYRLKKKSKIKKFRKLVRIPGKVKTKRVGRFATRMGSIISGLEITYIRKIKNGGGREQRIKKMLIRKIISLPKGAYNIRVKKVRT